MTDTSQDSSEFINPFDSDDDAEFQEIVTQRYMYNAGKCHAPNHDGEMLPVPLRGYMLNLVQMPPIRGRAWSAILIKTTKLTLAVGRDKKVVPVAVGSEVLIPATYELMQFLAHAATNETRVFEVRITPDVKIEIGGGQSMWTYKLGAKPKALPRAQFGLTAVLSPPQLPAATGQATDDDAMTFPLPETANN